ncbi:MAG: DUF998 domain-containing protein [Chloroflexi bacterium]|nr:DUF998 domain-containing protein [Chloroflexota bacterium]
MTNSIYYSSFLQVYPHFGWSGSLLILLGCLISGTAYKGKAGERYSILNHFISELGEIGISKAAAVFNLSLILGGTLFIPYIVGLGFSLSSGWGLLGMFGGVIAALSSIFVGVFSMDRLTPHRRAAMLFFRSGLFTVIFFTIAVFAQSATQRTIPLVVNVFGIIAILAYGSFLVIVSQKTDKDNQPNYILDPLAMPDRPRFWRTPFLEWLLFFSTIGWFLVVSLILLFRA